MFRSKTTFEARSFYYSPQYLAAVVALLLVLVLDTKSVFAAGLEPSPKKEVVSIRFVGRAAPVPITSFGANHHSFVAALRSGKGSDVSFVKIVYRFLSYDTSLPASLVDYNIEHRFRAARQTDCDELADTLLYSHRVATSGEISGREFSFQYAKNASEITIPPSTVLPCYIVTPADYKSSTRAPAADPDSIVKRSETLGSTKPTVSSQP